MISLFTTLAEKVKNMEEKDEMVLESGLSGRGKSYPGDGRPSQDRGAGEQVSGSGEPIHQVQGIHL